MKDSIKEKLNYYATDIGVYPAANNGVPRTTWQDGWNEWREDSKLNSDWSEEFKKGFIEAEKEYKNNLELYNDWYIKLSVKKEIIDDLLLKNKIDLMVIEGKVTMTLDSSDLFAWGYANFEIVESDDLEDVLKASSDDKWGIEKMLCRKHNMKPQYPIIKRMSEDGEWDKVMQNLPDNEFNISTGWPNQPD
jgi:hypothetical protein